MVTQYQNSNATYTHLDLSSCIIAIIARLYAIVPALCIIKSFFFFRIEFKWMEGQEKETSWTRILQFTIIIGYIALKKEWYVLVISKLYVYLWYFPFLGWMFTIDDGRLKEKQLKKPSSPSQVYGFIKKISNNVKKKLFSLLNEEQKKN